MGDEPNSILTGAQRAFLRKSEDEREADYSRQARSHHRRQIADRTRQAFHDFALLYDELDEDERNRIFDIEPIHDDVDGYNELRDALASTVAFLYRSLEGDVDSDTVRNRPFRVPFETVLTEGLKRGEADRYDWGRKSRVEVDYGGVEVIETTDPAALERGLRKLAARRRHELTESEMASILWHYEPDGIVDMLDGEKRGFSKLDERISELRDELGVGDFGSYEDDEQRGTTDGDETD